MKILTILIFLFYTTVAIAQQPNEEELFISFMKENSLSPDSKIGSLNKETFLELYCSSFDYNNYNKNSKNEFEFNDYKLKMKDLLTEKIENFSPTIYKTTVYGTFENYDFNRNYFPVTAQETNNITIPKNSKFNNILKDFLFKYYYRINFPNKEFNTRIPCTSDFAKEMLKKRTLKNGDINRNIYIDITYTISAKKIGGIDYYPYRVVHCDVSVMSAIVTVDYFPVKEKDTYNILPNSSQGETPVFQKPNVTKSEPVSNERSVFSNLGEKQNEILDKIEETYNFKSRINESATIDSFVGKFISSECKKGYFEFSETDIANFQVKTNRRNCINLLGNEKLTYKYDNGMLYYELGNLTKNGKLVFNVMLVFIDTNNELVVVNYATTDTGEIRATERTYKKE